MPFTTIRIQNETRDRLRNLGKKGETYDEILNRLMKIAETHQASSSDYPPFNRPYTRPSDFG